MNPSVLILTLNEERNIASCIRALEGIEDIVVLDSFSSDRTVEIAEALGARVYQRAFDNFAAQRNYALDEIPFENDWVLHLDADEILTRDSCEEIREATQSKRFDAYRLPSKMIFSGRWLRYSGMYPTYQVRLGRRDAAISPGRPRPAGRRQNRPNRHAKVPVSALLLLQGTDGMVRETQSILDRRGACGTSERPGWRISRLAWTDVEDSRAAAQGVEGTFLPTSLSSGSSFFVHVRDSTRFS